VASVEERLLASTPNRLWSRFLWLQSQAHNTNTNIPKQYVHLNVMNCCGVIRNVRECSTAGKISILDGEEF
jgi:hypothetical protein